MCMVSRFLEEGVECVFSRRLLQTHVVTAEIVAIEDQSLAWALSSREGPGIPAASGRSQSFTDIHTALVGSPQVWLVG